MAGNSIFTGQDGNIYVDFDVQNFIVVDPNKIVDNKGKIKERAVAQENLVMYANLETKLLPRTKLAVGQTVQSQITTVSIAEINFMKPGNQKYLTNEYTNEITGEGVFNKGTTNKSSASFNPSTGQKPVANVEPGLPKQNQNDTGLLGITSINCKVDTSFVPQVTIELEDVQGRALFEKGDLSPYAAFFQLPYPPFYLTMKGFYGQAIRYQLNLISFNARFNTYSGNYQVTLQFYGYKFNILNEVSMQAILAVPHMYSSQYTISKPLSDSTKSAPITQIEEGGTAKIHEVYRDYKQKDLIPKDFPELAVDEMLNRLEMFEINLTNSWTKEDVSSLTESVNFRNSLNAFLGEVYTNKDSWFEVNCDKEKALIVKGGGETLYPLKKTVQDGANQSGEKTKQEADAKLKALVESNNGKLADNSVFGSAQAQNKNLEVKSTVTYKNMFIEIEPDSIDYKATFKVRNKVDRDPSPEEEATLRAKIAVELITKLEFSEESKEKADKIKVYVFDGKDRFTGLINKMLETLNSKAQAEEERITQVLAAKLEDKAQGIGFRPSIKNIITVLMASTEAFIRLMDDVHKKAWDKRDDPDRKNAVMKFPSSDMKDNVAVSPSALVNLSAYVNSQQPIYPWPQYFVQDDKNPERFVIQYPGDRSVVDSTKGFDYNKWPEIQFVEEFIKASTEKGPQAQDNTQKDNEDQEINRLTLNGIEFPQTNIPYFTKEEVKFFFEIWERTYLNSHYNRFQRGGNIKEIYETIGRNEADNIINALGLSSPFLIQKLKNYGFNFKNFLGVLSHISNQGTGPSIQKLIRDIFATPYIQSEVDRPFEIYDQNTVDGSSTTVTRGLTQTDLNNFNSLIKANVQADFCDTYPFTDTSWNQKNLETSAKAGQGLFYNTKNTLFVNSDKKVISNFIDTTTKENIRPVTSFSYKNFTQPIVPQNNLNLFYQYRDKPSQFVSTEGYCVGFSGSGLATQTTSILNTPYFVNALQNGVQEWQAGNKNPYVQGAYLLLNSLPLSTLRGTYKNKGEVEGLDYIASSIKRFGGIHKLPYPWILKIGSVYHRYKKFVNDNVDILDSCWKNFDYVNNFDPITGREDKVYSLAFKQGVTSKVYLQGYYYNPPLPPPAVASLSFTSQTIQSGFYPKLINDMNVFLNGKTCFSTYSDEEIQLYVDSTMKVGNIEESSVDQVFVSGSTPLNIFKMNPWTTAIKNTSTGSYYTSPSFGSIYNQVPSSIFDTVSVAGQSVAKRNILSNPSIYNGSIRCFWGASNYGYFDVTSNPKPRPTEYLTLVVPEGEVYPMSLGFGYSSIEEIFSVFNKEQLDVMEQKFLDFSKSVYDINPNVGPGQPQITINVDTNDPDRYLKNFQLMVREFFEIPAPGTETNEDYLKKAINQQFGNIIAILNNFMEYNVVVKMGNPSNYNRKLFDSFNPDYETGYEFIDNTSTPSTTTSIGFKLVDPYKFETYIPESLPTDGGTTTLASSYSANSDAWKELLTQMGPSTIPKMIPSDNGSLITDFFVDNNIRFNKNNVQICAPLIRIYATQKLKDPTLNEQSFKSQVQKYSDQMLEYHENVFDNLFQNLQKGLPDVSYPVQGKINSAINGDVVKAQLYDNFKALNDKWIAGNAYNEETLLQDFLFVDRASRNVGDSILIDIFSVKNRLQDLNVSKSVYTMISGILVENNFTVMPLPAYVNFYNIQTPDGKNPVPKTENSADFANNLWGTFLSVDYRNSQPKLVCFYSEKPSNYPDLGRNKDFRYKNDGFNCNSVTNNPLLTNDGEKTNYALSNRCVGFNVDMGLRNQNVFTSFSVSQDIGKATSESLVAVNNLANQASGKDVASQNVSLLNIYNERSYSCNVVSLGNALIQPTMYFCLNHVPMFNGAYLITSVEHTITPGVFQTSFTGVRQRVFASIRPNNYLLSLNKNLLQKLTTTNLQNATVKPNVGDINQTSKKTNDAQNSCQDIVASGPTRYRRAYTAIAANETSVTLQSFVNSLATNLQSASSDQKLRSQLAMAVFVFSYVSSATSEQMKSFGNNYTNVNLQIDWGPKSDVYFEKQFCCVKIGTDKGSQSKPFARFENLDKFLKFMYDSLDQSSINNQYETVSANSFIPTVDSMYNYYKRVWPRIRNEQQQKDFETNQGKEVRAKISEALQKIGVLFPTAGIPFVSSANATTTSAAGQQVNSNVTPNADDRSILSSASPTSYTLNVSTLTNGFLKIDGNIGTQALAKEYKLKLSLVSYGGIQEVSVPIGETTLKAATFGQINGFSFTSTKSFRDTCSTAADNQNTLWFRAEVVEYPEYKYNRQYKVMAYDCPTRNLLPGDVVTVSTYNEIDANPCGICYPNGGRNIRINGKDCLPNTAPSRQNIFNITTDKNAAGVIIKVTFTVKPDVGLWKIFASSDTTICEGMSAYNQSEGTIAADYQSIVYNITDILDNCDAGSYTITMEPVADPRTPQGQNDPSREQTRGKYVVQGTK